MNKHPNTGYSTIKILKSIYVYIYIMDNIYLDSRIIILNSIDSTSLNETYKSNITFSFNGLLKQEEDIP